MSAITPCTYDGSVLQGGEVCEACRRTILALWLHRMTEPEHRHANGAAQLFQDEVQVLATLDHPNITRCATCHS